MDDYKKFFVASIKDNFPNDYKKIIFETEHHHKIISVDTAFARASPNPIDKRLDFCSYFLALIKALDEKGESFVRIREICLEIVIEYVKPRNKLQAWLKRMVPKLVKTKLGQLMVRKFSKKVSLNPNPAGFRARIITDKNETFGFGYGVDILECGICKLFAKHNYAKYASILCEVDEVTTQLAGLEMIRSGTIANGATKCDFRYKLKNTK